MFFTPIWCKNCKLMQKIEVHIKAEIQLALFNVTESIFLRVSFIFSSYFRCIFLTSLKAVAWNWNVKEWIQLALSSSSTSLRLFSFASSSTLHQQKAPSLLSSQPATKKRICHLCHRIYMTFNKRRSNPFPEKNPSQRLFVCIHQHGHWSMTNHKNNTMLCNKSTLTFASQKTILEFLWKCELT